MRPKGDMEQVQFWGPTDIRRHHTKFGGYDEPGDQYLCTPGQLRVQLALRTEQTQRLYAGREFKLCFCENKRQGFTVQNSDQKERIKRWRCCSFKL